MFGVKTCLVLEIQLESACLIGGVLNKGFTLACMPFKMSIDLDLRARMVGTSSQNIMFLRKGDLGRQEIHKNHQQ